MKIPDNIFLLSLKVYACKYIHAYAISKLQVKCEIPLIFITKINSQSY